MAYAAVAHHTRAATYHELAARHHRKAARLHQEVGGHLEAAQHATMAKGHAEAAEQAAGQAEQEYVKVHGRMVPEPGKETVAEEAAEYVKHGNTYARASTHLTGTVLAGKK